MRIGIECGGTFTDVVVVGDDGDIVATNKVFSTPSNPAVAVMEGLDALPSDLREGAQLLHGSTVATNALLERKGGPVALVTTRGFRDLVFLQRQDRSSMYALDYVKPAPLVERSAIFEVDERVAADGSVIEALDCTQAEEVAGRIASSGAVAVAVSFLHAYARPDHELAMAELLREAGITVPISLSHQVVKEFREYERTTTTTVDAFIRPRVGAYIDDLATTAGERGISSVGIMQSNGGLVPPEVAISRPVTMLLSGPAAGVSGAIRIGAAAGVDSMVTMDMGGTSTDVSFIQDGREQLVAETVVDGLPLRVPLVDINTVGAGGGSIVAIDQGGLLTVGPRSAGADPGPACYGRGGAEPTVTDANVLVGIMPGDAKLAGRFSLDIDAARRAFLPLAERLGSTVEAVAADAIQLANIAMAGTIREVSLERGHELESATIVAYGGAGALHAASVADELGIRRVIVPPNSGLTSAYGLLTSAFKRDHAATWFRHDLSRVSAEELAAQLDTVHGELATELRAQGIDPDPLTEAWVADVRYRGQGFELAVPFERGVDPRELAERFHAAHERQFGHASRSRVVQLVTLRLRLTGAEPPVARAVLPEPSSDRHESPVRFGEAVTSAQVLTRPAVTGLLPGPAIVTDESSTTYVPPGWEARLDDLGNLALERSAV